MYPTTMDSTQSCLLCCQPEPVPGMLSALCGTAECHTELLQLCCTSPHKVHRQCPTVTQLPWCSQPPKQNKQTKHSALNRKTVHGVAQLSWSNVLVALCTCIPPLWIVPSLACSVASLSLFLGCYLLECHDLHHGNLTIYRIGPGHS